MARERLFVIKALILVPLNQTYFDIEALSSARRRWRLSPWIAFVLDSLTMKVAIIFGSRSDKAIMQKAADVLREFGVEFSETVEPRTIAYTSQ